MQDQIFIYNCLLLPHLDLSALHAGFIPPPMTNQSFMLGFQKHAAWCHGITITTLACPPKKNETVSTDERCTHIRLASFFGSIKVRIGALSLRSLFYNSFPCSHGSFCLTRTPLILFFFSSSFLVSSAMLLLAYHIRTQAAIRTASNSFRGSIPSLLISFVCLLSRKMLWYHASFLFTFPSRTNEPNSVKKNYMQKRSSSFRTMVYNWS